MSLKAENLARGFDEPVVRDASLELRPGELVALLGPSGSGKTTLLQMLALLDRPQRGFVEIDGVRAWDLDVAARDLLRLSKVGLVFQRLNLLAHLTVLENVLLPAWRLGSRQAEHDARALLTEFDIGETSWRRKPGSLSRGEAQRVAIARALINRPSVVLADEPTGSLDGSSATVVLGVLESLRERGVAVLVVTHDLAVADRADRVLTLRDGRLEPSQRTRPPPP